MKGKTPYRKTRIRMKLEKKKKRMKLDFVSEIMKAGREFCEIRC